MDVAEPNLSARKLIDGWTCRVRFTAFGATQTLTNEVKV
jgi:hypothetical protein